MSKHHTLRTILPKALPVLLMATALLLTACGDKNDAGARADPTGKTPRDCADVRGSYSLAPADDSGGQFHLSATFLGASVPRTAGEPWQTISVDGNADTMLQLTFARPQPKRDSRQPPGDKSLPAYIRQAMETPFSQPVEKHSASVQRGVHYECKRGWLIGIGPQAASVQREAGGDLVGRLEVREARVFSVWAETGAGIPYWFDTKTRTSRWSVLNSVAVGRGETRAMSRFQKQEHDLEYGVSSAGAPRAKATSDAPYDANKALRALVDRDAIVEKISHEGGRYVITLRVESRGQVSRTLENLRADAYMQDVQDHGVITSGNGRDIATISARIVAPR